MFPTKTFIGLSLLALMGLWPMFLVGCGDNGPSYTSAQIARGEYLARHVSDCADCHTPLLPDGRPDETKLLAGGREFIPGQLWASNITPDRETGIGTWTDDQIVAAIREGRGHFEEAAQPSRAAAGEVLHPIMPSYVYANMTEADARAIVAYLRRKVNPIHNAVPERDANIVPPQPAPPLNYDQLPGSGPGKYLTSAAGVCIECHTPRTPAGALDPTRYFAGGEEFQIPGFKVFSSNITPDLETGLGSWTEEEISAAIQEGVDPEGQPLCPPMPTYGNLTSPDVAAMVQFLRDIPAIENAVEECQRPQ